MKHFVGTCLAAILTVSATASHAATTVSGTVSGNFSVNIAPIDSTRNTRLVLDIDAAQLLSSFLSERAYVSFKVADAFDEKGRPISFYEEDLGTEFLIAQPLTVGQTHFEFLINPLRPTCDPAKPPYSVCYSYANHWVTLEGITGAEPVNYSYSVTAVPEPAAWAMMIVGFGLAGATLRRRTALQPA